MQRIMKAAVAVTAACLLAAAPAVAFATDEVPAPEAVVTEVAEPVIEPAPEPEPAPPVVEQPAPEVEASVPEPPVVEPPAEPVPPAPVVEAAPPAVQTQGQPDHVCNEPGYEAKVDTVGDPATVSYTAPAGFLVDSYCVKAGTTKHVVPVTPPAASVVIDHPDKDSVSHYQVHLIPASKPFEVPPFETPTITVTWDCERQDWFAATTGIDPAQDRYAFWLDLNVDGEVDLTNELLVERAFSAGEFSLTDEMAKWNLGAPAPGATTFEILYIENGHTLHDTGRTFTVTIPEQDDSLCEVPPVSCVGSDIWYTEHDDLAPVATEAGLLFEGGSGKAVGIRTPVTGNLQGWESVSFVATGGTEQFFFRIVIDASADGGKAYQSLSFPGYTTIDSASVSYQFGESIAATAERFPNAVITSIGFQTNSGAPEGFEAVLSSMTGACGEVDWTWSPLPGETRVPGEWSEPVIDCESEVGDEVTITREVVITTWSRDEDGQPVSSEETVTENDVYIVTETDIEALECPVVEPTPTPEPTAPAPTPAPAQTPPPTALAATGSSLSPVVGLGALALVLAGAGIAVAARRR